MSVATRPRPSAEPSTSSKRKKSAAAPEAEPAPLPLLDDQGKLMHRDPSRVMLAMRMLGTASRYQVVMDLSAKWGIAFDSARGYVRAAERLLRPRNDEQRDQMRAAANARILDTIEKAASVGEYGAVAKLLERQAKMFGLDAAPKKPSDGLFGRPGFLDIGGQAGATSAAPLTRAELSEMAEAVEYMRLAEAKSGSPSDGDDA